MEKKKSATEKIKRVFPLITIIPSKFDIESVIATHNQLQLAYIEDPVSFTEVKKLINSIALGYPFVIIRVSAANLNDSLMDLIGQCQQMFMSQDYLFLVAYKGSGIPTYLIREKFKCNTIISVKPLA
jgi:hypothetical protein